jgi:2,4-dienoyl-CoA reductase-like NADH-dependent reductase (Old Yellow Enzyme family)
MNLFEPVIFRSGLSLPNRIVLAPMTTYSSYEDGRIREDELLYLRRRAEGGFGAVMTAACYVHPGGHAFDGQWGCDSDETLPSLRAAAYAIRAGGSVAILQIHHGGRQCPSRLCGGQPVSASAVPAERANAETPRALDQEEIESIVAAFGAATARAKEAGFDGVEIHGANTYLLQQFVSPHSNRRSDAWGLDRLKFPLAVAEACLSAAGPTFSVGYRFSPEELETPGIRWPDTVALVRALLELPLDYLHVSLGKYYQSSIVGDYDEPTIVRLAKIIQRRVPLIGVGSIRTGEDAQQALALGADLVAVGRAGVSEPDWPNKVRDGQPLRLQIPAEDAGRICVIPAGLERKIYATPGWFEVEAPARV